MRGIDQVGQSVGISGFEFGQFAILEHFLRHFVDAGQLFESFGGGGAGLARTRCGMVQIQLVEEDFGELLRRIDLEFEAGEFVDCLSRAAISLHGASRNRCRGLSVRRGHRGFPCARARARAADRFFRRVRRGLAFRLLRAERARAGRDNRRVRRARRKEFDSSGAGRLRRRSDLRWSDARDRNKASWRGECPRPFCCNPSRLGEETRQKSFGSWTILGRFRIGAAIRRWPRKLRSASSTAAE